MLLYSLPAARFSTDRRLLPAEESAELQARLRAAQAERDAARDQLTRQAKQLHQLQAKHFEAADQLYAAGWQHQQQHNCSWKADSEHERAAWHAERAALQRRCTTAEAALHDSHTECGSLAERMLASQVCATSHTPLTSPAAALTSSAPAAEVEGSLETMGHWLYSIAHGCMQLGPLLHFAACSDCTHAGAYCTVARMTLTGAGMVVQREALQHAASAQEARHHCQQHGARSEAAEAEATGLRQNIAGLQRALAAAQTGLERCLQQRNDVERSHSEASATAAARIARYASAASRLRILQCLPGAPSPPVCSQLCRCVFESPGKQMSARRLTEQHDSMRQQLQDAASQPCEQPQQQQLPQAALQEQADLQATVSEQAAALRKAALEAEALHAAAQGSHQEVQPRLLTAQGLSLLSNWDICLPVHDVMPDGRLMLSSCFSLACTPVLRPCPRVQVAMLKLCVGELRQELTAARAAASAEEQRSSAESGLRLEAEARITELQCAPFHIQSAVCARPVASVSLARGSNKWSIPHLGETSA